MTNTKPLRCQKCGKPLGYVTVLAKGITSLPQPLQNVKLIAICMECYQKREYSTGQTGTRTMCLDCPTGKYTLSKLHLGAVCKLEMS